MPTLMLHSQFTPTTSTEWRRIHRPGLPRKSLKAGKRFSISHWVMNVLRDDGRSPSFGGISMAGRKSRDEDRIRVSAGTVRNLGSSEINFRLKLCDGQVVDDAGKIYDVHEATKRIPWV